MRLVIFSVLGGLLSLSAWAQEKEGEDLHKQGLSLTSEKRKDEVSKPEKKSATGQKKIVLPTLDPLPLVDDRLLPRGEKSLPALPPKPDFSRARKARTSSKKKVIGQRVITPIQNSERKMRWIAGKWVIGLK